MDPTGLVINSAGDVFLADPDVQVVREIAPGGTETVVAGDGSFGYSGDGGVAAAAQLGFPSAVALDAAGNLLIADQDNNRVRMVAASNCASSCAYGLASTTAGDIYTVVGDGTAGSVGDGSAATSAELNFPDGVAFDAAGNLFIADYNNNRVRMVAASNCTSSCAYGLSPTTKGDIYTVAGDGTGGFSGDGGPATSAELRGPEGMAFDMAGDLLVSDSLSPAVRLVAASSCASACAYGLPPTTEGDVYTVAGDGNSGSTGDGGPATAAQLDVPSGISVDSAGNLLIADQFNQRVRMVAAAACTSSCLYGLSTTEGDIYAIAGDGTAGYSGDGGAATSAELHQPKAVAVDSNGDLLISDNHNDVIRLVAASACLSSCAYGLQATTKGDIYTIAGDGTTAYSGDGGAATLAELNSPLGTAVDSAGDIFIGDLRNSVVRMVAVTTCTSSCPYGLTSTTKGDIYTVAGNGTAGYSGDGGPATSAELQNFVAGVAVDSAGNVLIADGNNNRIRMVASSDCSSASACGYGLSSTTKGDIYTVAGDASSGFSGDNGPATSAALNSPIGVAADSSGNLLIADFSNRIRMVAGSSCSSSCYGLSGTAVGDIYTIAGNGTQGYNGDAIPASTAELNLPQGVALDSAGNLLISDSGNNRIRMVAGSSCSSSCLYGLSTTAGDIYTIAGDGTGGYTGDGTPATSGELKIPQGVTGDSAGDLLIADTGNDVVRLVAASTCSSSCAYGLPSTTAGDIYTLAGNGTSGYAGDGGPAASAEFRNPESVAVAPGGGLLIADSGNNRIRMVTEPPVVTTTSGTTTYPEGAAAVAVDPGVTVSDAGSTTLDSATVSITTGFASGDTLGFTNQNGISGSYDAGTGVLTLTGASTLANYQTALESITFSTTSATTGDRTVSFLVNDGTNSSNTATKTVDVFGGSPSEIYVANAAGNTVTVYPPGAHGNASPTVTVSASGGSLQGPSREAFDAAGDLWVDNGNDRNLVEYTPAQLAAGGSPTPAVTVTTSLAPTGLAFDSAGDMWVASNKANAYSVVEFTPAQLASSGTPTPTVTISSTGGGSLNGPVALAFDSAGDLWVGNGNGPPGTIVEFTPAQLASSGSPTPAVTISSNPSSRDDLNGMAFDPSGDLWATYYDENQVIEYTPAQLSTSGSPAPAATISAAGGSLTGPDGAVFDASGDLLVVNDATSGTGANTVVEYTPSQLSTSGTPAPAATIGGAGTGLDAPVGIAIPPTIHVAPSETLTVSVNGTGSGSVTSDPAGITCPASCSAQYNQGTQVILTATASSGSTFAGWSGAGCSGTGTCQVTMSSAESVTATFNTSPGGGGAGGGGGGVSTPAPTTTTAALSSSANPAAVGQEVIYTASVAPTPDGGTVSFTDGGSPISGCSSVAVSSATGSATCDPSYPNPGTHSIGAAYSGDAGFAPSSAPALSQVVQAPSPVSAPPPAAGPCASASGNTAFVCSAYQHLLGRPADGVGLSTYLGLLAGGASRADVAHYIVTSPEYGVDLVQGYYQAFLGRAADPSGLADWTRALAGGATEQSVEAGILASPEFYGRSGASPAGFIGALYDDLLGRPVDPSGLADWKNVLASSGREAVTSGILRSPESLADFVAGQYERLLGRAPHPGGLAAWTTMLSEGASYEEVISGLVGSAEFDSDATA